MDGYISNYIAPDLRTLIAAYFGLQVRVVPRESDVSVGAAAVQLGQFANGRTAVGYSNTSANPVALGFTSGVTLTTGIILPASASLFFSWYYDNEIVFQPMWAIAGSPGNGIHVVEYVIMGAS